ncbi:phospholipid methyltransferase, partial [Rhizobium ruizarguesonis]
PGGAVYKFTYGPRCPVPRPILDRNHLKSVSIGGTVRNLPPASVYRNSRSRPLDLTRERIGYRESETDLDDAAFSHDTG